MGRKIRLTEGQLRLIVEEVLEQEDKKQEEAEIENNVLQAVNSFLSDLKNATNNQKLQKEAIGAAAAAGLALGGIKHARVANAGVNVIAALIKKLTKNTKFEKTGENAAAEVIRMAKKIHEEVMSPFMTVVETFWPDATDKDKEIYANRLLTLLIAVLIFAALGGTTGVVGAVSQLTLSAGADPDVKNLINDNNLDLSDLEDAAQAIDNDDIGDYMLDD